MELRYKISEILMVLGVVLCVIVTIHVAALVNNIAVAASYSERYKYEAVFTVFHSEMEIEWESEDNYSRLVPWNMTPLDIDTIAKCAEDTPFDIKFCVNFQVGQSIVSSPVEIRFGKFENRERLSDGDYISKKNYDKVYISQSVSSYIEYRDGIALLNLNGRLVEVAGIFESTGSLGYEDKIVLYYEDCSDELKQIINSAILEVFYNGPMPSLILLSNEIDPSAEWENNVSVFQEANLVCYITKNIYSGSRKNVFGSFSVIFMTVLYVFSAANLSVLCSFWVRNRKKELLIRKIHGETNYKIAFLFIKDFIKILIYAIISAIPIEILLSLLWTDAKSTLYNIVITASVFLMGLASFIAIISVIAATAYRKISLVGKTYE